MNVHAITKGILTHTIWKFP